MVYYVDNQWVPVPDAILLDFKLKWNTAPAAKLLSNGNWGIAGEIRDGVRKVFNEYSFEWIAIDQDAKN